MQLFKLGVYTLKVDFQPFGSTPTTLSRAERQRSKAQPNSN